MSTKKKIWFLVFSFQFQFLVSVYPTNRAKLSNFCIKGFAGLYTIMYRQYVQDSIEVSYLNHLKAYANYSVFNPEKYIRISANSFRGNYSFLNLALFTVTFDRYYINLNSCGRNYSREETIQGRKLFAEIRYIESTKI